MERTTRFVILLAFQDGIATTDGARKRSRSALESLPQALRRTLTWDQGKELAMHQQITVSTGAGVFFCDAHSPWQRGSNENMNGLLRDYFPKGTDLSMHTPRTSPGSLRRSTTGRARHSAGNAQSICSTPKSRWPPRERQLRRGAHRDADRLGPSGLRLTASRSCAFLHPGLCGYRIAPVICCDVGWLSPCQEGRSSTGPAVAGVRSAGGSRAPCAACRRPARAGSCPCGRWPPRRVAGSCRRATSAAAARGRR